jgi:Rrf2 family protein
MMELALREGEGAVPAHTIAHSQGIPLRFLEQQLNTLSKAGLVASYRGVKGGCLLAKPASQIRILDVIDVLEGPVMKMGCQEGPEDACAQSTRCGLEELWRRVQISVRAVFADTTLADLAHRHGELQPCAALWPDAESRRLPVVQ